MTEIITTAIGSMGGGLTGAIIKIVVGYLAAKAEDKKHEREALRGVYDKARHNVNLNPYVSRTRRLLALSICWTFCGVVILWAIFPGKLISIPTDKGEISLLYGLVEFTTEQSLLHVSTGSIAWGMIPFMSMVLGLYFTPDIRRV